MRIPALPLDREIVEELAAEFMAVIVAHYRSRPTARSTVQEILNALGSSAAVVIHGTDDPQGRIEARAFFERALDDQLEALAEQEKNPGLEAGASREEPQ